MAKMQLPRALALKKISDSIIAALMYCPEWDHLDSEGRHSLTIQAKAMATGMVNRTHHVIDDRKAVRVAK